MRTLAASRLGRGWLVSPQKGCWTHQAIYRARFCVSHQTVQDPRVHILETALNHVDTLGWTQHALAQAAMDIGMTPMSSSVVHRGPVEMVEYLLKKKRAHVQTIATASSECPSDALGEAEQYKLARLAALISAHMEYLGPYKNTWPSALALLAEPQNAASTLALLQELADDLCNQAGIKSSRMDWYAERGLLLSLYAATECYFLTDSSPNLNDTKNFLKRSLDVYATARGYLLPPLFKA